MTTIIIQGNKVEQEKTINVLKKVFPIINKKASYSTEYGVMQIIEVSTKPAVDGLNEDEVLQGLTCCTNVVKDCMNCPYRGISDCQQQMHIDSAVVVNRMMHNASKQ